MIEQKDLEYSRFLAKGIFPKEITRIIEIKTRRFTANVIRGKFLSLNINLKIIAIGKTTNSEYFEIHPTVIQENNGWHEEFPSN
ncbi:TPA: hypothetical protein DEP94_00645 [Candidatus Nomurabacteria bacterium]|nr:hypothetical protein [Candidatus Nomurabacteria bacterium]